MKGSPADRLLFIHNYPARFVEIDRELLGERWKVEELYLRGRQVPWASMTAAVRRAGVIYVWFASWHALAPLLLSRLMSRPSILVVGGYDVANLPEIGYGHQRGGLQKTISSVCIKMAVHLITNSNYSRRETSRNVGIPPERLRVIYHGVADPYGTLPAGPRPKVAISVGNVDRGNLYRKGHEPFVRAAKHLEDFEFILVGDWKDDAVETLRDLAPANVRFTGWVNDRHLFELYRHAATYVQVSAHEGFGLSVAESMLAGCIPVVTRAGALPEVVGEQGIYVPSQDPQGVATAVLGAMRSTSNDRFRARQHVLDTFPMDRRRRALHSLVSSALG